MRLPVSDHIQIGNRSPAGEHIEIDIFKLYVITAIGRQPLLQAIGNPVWQYHQHQHKYRNSDRKHDEPCASIKGFVGRCIFLQGSLHDCS